jgi:hypothetical protein
MINKDETLYFSSIIFNGYQNDFWQGLYEELPIDSGGRFAINTARRVNPNRFISRDKSIWTTPFPQKVWPGFEMPAYDANFSMTFDEVSDRRALEIKERINNGNERFAVMWSGGIDSTVIMTALLRNLTTAELKNVAVCTSMAALLEHPDFWTKYISGKFQLFDSLTIKYHDLIEKGYTPITGDEGDCIFGTSFGLSLYYNWEAYANKLSPESKAHIASIIDRATDPSVHYSQFKDLLVAYFTIPRKQGYPYVSLDNPDPNFGLQLYEKYALSAETSDVPVISLHDYFWWLIFNVKYLNCAVRGGLYFNDRISPKEGVESIVNWFNGDNYQLWSMANNNNGQKIHLNASSYKWAARQYLYSFDKNNYYKHFKLKLESMGIATNKQNVTDMPAELRPNARFGVDSNYNLLLIDSPDVQDYIRHHMHNFKLDWV